MSKELKSIGSPRGLRFDFSWPNRPRKSSADEATYCDLLVWLDQELVWGEYRFDGNHQPLSWSWIELLDFLSINWPYLEYGTGYPLGLNPSWPVLLRKDAEERWQELPDEIAWRREDDILFAFEESHDLACALQGYTVPSLWIVREQGTATVGSDRATIRQPIREVLDTLSSVGDQLVEHIAALSDPRSRSARQSWIQRRQRNARELTKIAIDISDENLKIITGDKTVEDIFEFPKDGFDLTEPLGILAMARGVLDVTQLENVLSIVKSIPHSTTEELDKLSTEAENLSLKFSSKKPWDQGHQLAQWLRSKSSMADDDDRVDPEGLLAEFRVLIKNEPLGDKRLDALACWGPRHGPGILVNMNEHNDISGARRATLAHELCHLLIDRRQALPLGDVIDGNVPKWIEQRANAFAAEFLLPKSLAGQVFEASESSDACVEFLTKRFGVSKELTAWQIRRSGVTLSPHDYHELRKLVANPRMF